MSTVFPHIGQDDEDKYYIAFSFSDFLLAGYDAPTTVIGAEHHKALNTPTGQKGSYYYPTREEAEKALKKCQVPKGVIKENVEESSWVTNL